MKRAGPGLSEAPLVGRAGLCLTRCVAEDSLPGLWVVQVLDTARAAADLMGVAVANCPTSAASDAPCSAASVVYTPEGVVDHHRFFK